jgi:ABC-type multidrug transport system ATPase subunit
MTELTLRIVTDGESHVFGEREIVTLGRHVDSALRLNNPEVSRNHAIVSFADGHWTISDAGSRNGTFRDDEQISSHTITEPVTIRLGGPAGALLDLTVEQSDSESFADQQTMARPGSVIADFTQSLDPQVTQQAVGTTRIGRAADNTVVIDDLLVSRYHAEVRGLATGGFELEDLGSHNGTFLNGRRIEGAVDLTHADLVTIGHHLFRLRENELVAFVDDGSIAFGADAISVVTSDGTQLLDGVSIALEERGFLAVVGPSGSGKSTLLRALSGIRPGDSGTVSYAGRDLYADYDELRQRIGFVPQDDVVHTELTVHEALDASAELRFPPDTSREERSARVDEVLEELGLDGRSDVTVASLSGGQRKRVSVAIELLTRPSLLFLDEPTSGLDPGTERSVMELLRELADSGRTVVVVTHSVESLHMCDRVLVLAGGGRTAYFGPPQLTPAYFGRSDMQGVFQRLNREIDRDWKGRYAAHADRARFMPHFDLSAGPRKGLSKAPPSSRVRQLRTLLSRDLRIMAKDRRTAIGAVVQGPVLGLILLVALEADSLNIDGPVSISGASVSILLMVVAASLIGVSNGLRAIVSEAGIYQRERRAGLSSGAYLMSKLIILGSLSVIQVTIMSAMALINQGGPSDALILGNARIELVFVMVTACLSALFLALAISALVRSSDQAVALIPVVLIVMLIFAIPDVTAKPGVSQVSKVASSQWAMRAAGATIDLNRLQLVNNLLAEVGTTDAELIEDVTRAVLDPNSDAVAELAEDQGDSRFTHDRPTWLGAMTGMALTALVSLLITSFALRRRSQT